MKISSQKIKRFQKEILEWYKINKRDLPWRRDRNPYYILISEVMLQQTQVGRVIPKYEEWLEKFPTVESLAKASTADVLRAWSGLGYNRRALYLQQTANRLQSIAQSKNAVVGSQKAESKIQWPKTEQELRKLPGIGEYTARAILCFAFGEQIAVVDTNIRKVILTNINRKGLTVKRKDEGRNEISHFARNDKRIQHIANELLPKGKAYEWNQALMDYAACDA